MVDWLCCGYVKEVVEFQKNSVGKVTNGVCAGCYSDAATVVLTSMPTFPDRCTTIKYVPGRAFDAGDCLTQVCANCYQRIDAFRMYYHVLKKMFASQGTVCRQLQDAVIPIPLIALIQSYLYV